MGSLSPLPNASALARATIRSRLVCFSSLRSELCPIQHRSLRVLLAICQTTPLLCSKPFSGCPFYSKSKFFNGTRSCMITPLLELSLPLVPPLQPQMPCLQAPAVAAPLPAMLFHHTLTRLTLTEGSAPAQGLTTSQSLQSVSGTCTPTNTPFCQHSPVLRLRCVLEGAPGAEGAAGRGWLGNTSESRGRENKRSFARQRGCGGHFSHRE